MMSKKPSDAARKCVIPGLFAISQTCVHCIVPILSSRAQYWLNPPDLGETFSNSGGCTIVLQRPGLMNHYTG